MVRSSNIFNYIWTHVCVVLAADERARLRDAEGEGVELLAVAGHAGLRVELAQALLGAAKHLRGAHGLVVNRLCDAVAVEYMRVGLNEQVGHEIHNVAAREVGAGVLVVRLREALNEVLEDVAHVHSFDLVGRHVSLRLAEVTDNLVEQWCVRIGKALDLVGELHARQDVLHVVREPVDVVLDSF